MSSLPDGPPLGALHDVQQAPAFTLQDIDSLRPDGCVTLPVIGNFFRSQFEACLRQEKAEANLASCLVFGPDTWDDLRRLLLPADGEAGAGQQSFPALERFCREHDLASKQYLLLPLLTPSHGSLLIFCQPVERDSPHIWQTSDGTKLVLPKQEPLILHLDSLSGHGSLKGHAPNCAALVAFLQRQVSKGNPALLKEPKMCFASVPQQGAAGLGSTFMCTSAFYFVAKLPPVLDLEEVKQLKDYKHKVKDLFEAWAFRNGDPWYPGFLTTEWYPRNVPDALRKLLLSGVISKLQASGDSAATAALLVRANEVQKAQHEASQRQFEMPTQRLHKQLEMKRGRLLAAGRLYWRRADVWFKTPNGWAMCHRGVWSVLLRGNPRTTGLCFEDVRYPAKQTGELPRPAEFDQCFGVPLKQGQRPPPFVIHVPLRLLPPEAQAAAAAAGRMDQPVEMRFAAEPYIAWSRTFWRLEKSCWDTLCTHLAMPLDGCRKLCLVQRRQAGGKDRTVHVDLELRFTIDAWLAQQAQQAQQLEQHEQQAQLVQQAQNEQHEQQAQQAQQHEQQAQQAQPPQQAQQAQQQLAQPPQQEQQVQQAQIEQQAQQAHHEQQEHHEQQPQPTQPTQPPQQEQQAADLPPASPLSGRPQELAGTSVRPDAGGQSGGPGSPRVPAATCDRDASMGGQGSPQQPRGAARECDADAAGDQQRQGGAPDADDDRTLSAPGGPQHSAGAADTADQADMAAASWLAGLRALPSWGAGLPPAAVQKGGSAAALQPTAKGAKRLQTGTDGKGDRRARLTKFRQKYYAGYFPTGAAAAQAEDLMVMWVHCSRSGWPEGWMQSCASLDQSLNFPYAFHLATHEKLLASLSSCRDKNELHVLLQKHLNAGGQQTRDHAERSEQPASQGSPPASTRSEQQATAGVGTKRPAFADGAAAGSSLSGKRQRSAAVADGPVQSRSLPSSGAVLNAGQQQAAQHGAAAGQPGAEDAVERPAQQAQQHAQQQAQQLLEAKAMEVDAEAAAPDRLHSRLAEPLGVVPKAQQSQLPAVKSEEEEQPPLSKVAGLGTEPPRRPMPAGGLAATVPAGQQLQPPKEAASAAGKAPPALRSASSWLTEARVVLQGSDGGSSRWPKAVRQQAAKALAAAIGEDKQIAAQMFAIDAALELLDVPSSARRACTRQFLQLGEVQREGLLAELRMTVATGGTVDLLEWMQVVGAT